MTVNDIVAQIDKAEKAESPVATAMRKAAEKVAKN